jgi:hypothetical protein
VTAAVISTIHAADHLVYTSSGYAQERPELRFLLASLSEAGLMGIADRRITRRISRTGYRIVYSLGLTVARGKGEAAQFALPMAQIAYGRGQRGGGVLGSDPTGEATQRVRSF